MNSDQAPIYEESIELINDLEELDRLDQKLQALWTSAKMDKKTLFYLNLIGDEIITNIISYGFEDDNQHIIRLNLVLAPTHWILEIRDDGRLFNPLEHDDPQHHLAIEDRPLGGLGIHFVKQIMDEISYERKESHNIISMKKYHIRGNEG